MDNGLLDFLSYLWYLPNLTLNGCVYQKFKILNFYKGPFEMNIERHYKDKACAKVY